MTDRALAAAIGVGWIAVDEAYGDNPNYGENWKTADSTT